MVVDCPIIDQRTEVCSREACSHPYLRRLNAQEAAPAVRLRGFANATLTAIVFVIVFAPGTEIDRSEAVAEGPADAEFGHECSEPQELGKCYPTYSEVPCCFHSHSTLCCHPPEVHLFSVHLLTLVE